MTTQNPIKFQPVDYIKITIFGFALSVLWGSLQYVVIPLRLLDFVPQALKNTYLDLLILAGLILAMIIQPVVGIISDRSNFRWGRRKPFILLGTILVVLSLPGIGLAGSYVAIFVTYCLLQVSSNIAEGPYRAFFPDLLPAENRGKASGVRGLLNTLGSIGIVGATGFSVINYLSGAGVSGLWLALIVPAVVLIAAMLATLLTVREQPGTGRARLPPLSSFRQNFRVNIRGRFDFLAFLVGSFLAILAWNALIGHAIYYIIDVAGAAKAAKLAPEFLLAAGIGALAVVYPAGHLSDKFGRKPIAIGSVVLSALVIVKLLFGYSYTHTQVMVSASLLGICGGAWLSSQWALATDLVARGGEARDLGLVNISSAGASALSRVFGPIIDSLNIHSPHLGYRFMLLACAIFFVAASLFLARVKMKASSRE
jgi:Na+/melibiose symporter-like transporter